MSLDPAAFDLIQPTDEQLYGMEICREGAKVYFALLDQALIDGPDKTYVMRKLRELAMWVNVAITRNSDGSPRE